MRSESKYFVTIVCDAIARDDELTYEKFTGDATSEIPFTNRSGQGLKRPLSPFPPITIIFINY